MPCTPLFLFPPYQKPPFNVLRRWRNTKKTALIIGLPQRRDAKKTAEERFNMLARGWLAYPVTSMHAHLPPKSGCRNVIPRLANNLYNRSSAVDSLIHNQPQVGKPTWGYNYTTALRRLPSAIGRHLQKRPPPSATIPIAKTRHRHRIARCKKNRRRAVSHVSTGLARLPRDINAFATTAEERLYMSPLDLPTNLYNRSSAVDSSFHNQPQVGEPTWGYNYPTALRRLPSANGRHLQKRPPPTATIHIAKTRHHHRIAPTARCENRRRAVAHVSTGLACLPRDANPSASTAEERL